MVVEDRSVQFSATQVSIDDVVCGCDGMERQHGELLMHVRPKF